MNSCTLNVLSACFPPFIMFIIGIGNVLALAPPIYLYRLIPNAFAAALAAAKEGNTILLLPGAYTGDAKISINNLTITSLNGDFIPGQLVTRFDEATYDGKLTLAKELKGLTIKGIKFIGTSQILNEKGEAGTAQATTTNLDGFNFINNLVLRRRLPDG